MDFEDFEFKPLTEGLGFHKKNPTQKSNELPPLEPKSQISSKISSALDGLNAKSSNKNILKVETPKFEDPRSAAPTADANRLDMLSFESSNDSKVELPSLDLFSKPLPRTEQDVPKKLEPTSSQPIPKYNPRFGRPLSKIGQQDATLPNPAIQDQKIQDSGLLSVLDSKIERTQEKLKPNKIDQTVEVKYTEVPPTPLSMFLDLTVITGISILFTLGLIVATRVEIVPILNNIAQDTGAQIAVALLVYSVSQMYLILARSFFGQTLGEWSMDTQLGMAKEQETLSYIFRLIGRTLLLTITGFIVLPIVSMIFGKDYAGRATGLKLYRK